MKCYKHEGWNLVPLILGPNITLGSQNVKTYSGPQGIFFSFFQLVLFSSLCQEETEIDSKASKVNPFTSFSINMVILLLLE